MKGQTISAYKELIETLLSQDYKICTVYEYLTQKTREKGIVILRHDVDVDPHRALRMARLEHKLGVHSTYYFRYIPKIFDESVIKSINDMGFEIGYHFETLDKTHGNFPKAVKLFKDELQEFRKIADVKTVCAHGNVIRDKHYPRTNNDIFKFEPNLLHEVSLIGEAYLSFIHSPVVLISDVYRRFNGCESIRKLVQKIKLSERRSYCMSFHPCRWSVGLFDSLMTSTRIRLSEICANLYRFLRIRRAIGE